jgi:hypothetical protein
MHEIVRSLERRGLHASLAIALLAWGPTAADAQSSVGPVARTAETGQGEIGRRQTQDEAAPNVQPLVRISNRIDSRINLRIQNRLDRFNSSEADVKTRVEAAVNTARHAQRAAEPLPSRTAAGG